MNRLIRFYLQKELEYTKRQLGFDDYFDRDKPIHRKIKYAIKAFPSYVIKGMIDILYTIIEEKYSHVSTRKSIGMNEHIRVDTQVNNWGKTYRLLDEKYNIAIQCIDTKKLEKVKNNALATSWRLNSKKVQEDIKNIKEWKIIHYK